MQKGANVNSKIKELKPLHRAAIQGHYKIAKLLISKGADVNGKDEYGQPPLVYALAKGGREKDSRKKRLLVGLLIKHKTNLNYSGGGVFHGLAAITMQKEILNFQELKKYISLLKNSGANINQKNKKGMTPLFAAIYIKNIPYAKLMTISGADVNLSVKGGFSPLHMASMRGNNNLIELLLLKGAKINAQLKNGATPLDAARAKNNRQTVQLLRRNGGKGKMELE